MIKDEHFKPAFEYGLKIHDQEIETIANNPAKPTFQNTVLALEIMWSRFEQSYRYFLQFNRFKYQSNLTGY